MSYDFSLTLDLGMLGERDVDFSVNYTPGTPDVYYLRNGDPGHPGDPPELEILSACIGKTDIAPLLPENDDLYEQLLDRASQIAYDGG